MRHLLFAIVFGATSANVASQNREPIFREKTDSIEYVTVLGKIRKVYEAVGKVSEKKRDSLMAVANYWMEKQQRLREKIVGYRLAYLPTHRLLADVTPVERDTVTALTLTKLDALPKDLFLFKNLKTLELIDCRIPKLPRQLRRLKNLTQLSVYTDRSDKRISLPKNKSIKTLVISSAHLPKKFRSLKKMHRLDLSRNNLSEFPNIRGCRHLKELSLRENQLTLKKLKAASTSLEVLELQKNQITEIPATIAQFPKLKRLVLNYNVIERIDPKLAALKQLEQVGFYSNQLTAVPDVLYQITSLKEIDLYYNQIERLDSRVSHWKNLQVLYLANNKLISLPENLGELANLRELYLHNNRLSALPESLTQLTNLKVLRVNSNYLPSLPNIAAMQNLENIDLSNNQLQTLPSNIFKFANLKIISLLGNQWDDATRQEIKKGAEELEKREVNVLFN